MHKLPHRSLVVGICGALLAHHAPAAGFSAFDTPLRPIDGGIHGIVRAVELDNAAYEALACAGTETVELRQFPLSDGRAVDLSLSRVRVFDGTSRVVVGTAEGDVAVPLPEMVMLSGTVRGAEDSRVFLSFSPAGSNGWIEFDGERFVLAAGRAHTPMCVYNSETLPAGLLDLRMPACGGALAVPGRHDHGGQEPEHEDPSPLGPGCRIVKLDIETDYEYAQLGAFGGSTSAAATYAATLVGGMSTIFQAEVNTAFVIGYLRVWGSNNDPYPDGSTVNQRLDELRAHWNSVNPPGNTNRTIAHILTGRNSGAGGIAYLGVLCESFWQLQYSYGASGHLNGSFPNPLINNSHQNWDIMVLSHEVGHNFNAPHTHDLTPVIDGCGIGDCSAASTGSIMSYCHICPGGLSNIALTLHPRMVNERIIPYLTSTAAPCVTFTGINVTGVSPSTQTRAVGEQAVFTASVTPTSGVLYRWKRGGVTVSNGTQPGGSVASGATTPTLTISNLSAADAGTYTAEAYNYCGMGASGPATLLISGAGCDSIDFNNDGVSPDTADIADFLSVFGGGACSTGTCNDIDFNNDGVAPDTTDMEAFLRVFGGGVC